MSPRLTYAARLARLDTMIEEGRIIRGRYGHVAKKATWLYAFGIELPALRWGAELDTSSKALVSWCGNAVSNGMEGRPRVGKAAARTPPEFREALLAMARSASASRAA